LFDRQKWKSWLQIVGPDCIPRWHRKFAGWIHGIKSRPKKTKQPTNQEIRDLIRKMYRENNWGAETIRGELLKLRIRRAKLTIQRILKPIQTNPSPQQKQNWRTFVKNHLPYIWSVDFFTVPTNTSITTITFALIRASASRYRPSMIPIEPSRSGLQRRPDPLPSHTQRPAP
jgi:hypothetical protein